MRRRRLQSHKPPLLQLTKTITEVASKFGSSPGDQRLRFVFKRDVSMCACRRTKASKRQWLCRLLLVGVAAAQCERSGVKSRVCAPSARVAEARKKWQGVSG